MLKYLLLFSLLLPAMGGQSSNPENDLFQINAGRPLLDAHNCYPYDGKWPDRIDRALKTGFPAGIEQDIAPYRDPGTGEVIAKVTHNGEASAAEPSLKQHFFEHVRPIVERALKEKSTERWPLIVVHFDFKNNSVPTLEAVAKLLDEYQDWITTGTKTANDRDLSHLVWKPLLVLTEDNDQQEQVFYRRLAVGGKMRIFGSAHTNEAIFKGLDHQQRAYAAAHAAPELLLQVPATNYRRWWNNPWGEVEQGGQREAGAWTGEDDERLRALVGHAHRLGYWIRFYTLDGFLRNQGQGWGEGYNFGSPEAVMKRWRASLDAGVNLIATDQYESFHTFMANPVEPKTK